MDTSHAEGTSPIWTNQVWKLTPKHYHANIIGTKWIFKNKNDEKGNVTRNKAHLVAQEYAQIEGVDFRETFTSISRLESIWLLLDLVCFQKFKLHQIDVKNACLNRYISEEVYIAHPKGFIDLVNQDYVYKLHETLYGLK